MLSDKSRMMGKIAEGCAWTAEGKRNPKIDPYFNKLKQWKEEFKLHREIVLDCGLCQNPGVED